MEYMKISNNIPFMKMHGLGNDFVVLDARTFSYDINKKLIISLSDRNRGVGFDQLVVIKNDKSSDLNLTFYNADGTQIATCGNATRCVAQYEMRRVGKESLKIKTTRGILEAIVVDSVRTRVNMGHPFVNWAEIPIAKDIDTLKLPIDGSPTATGMGNPHCTFFVDDADSIDLKAFGNRFENHSLFPNGTNVQVVSFLEKNHLRMRVWERGVGHTLASGSSACASAVAASRLGLSEKAVKIDLDGGQLDIEWLESGVWMTGESVHVFSGKLTQEFLESI
ncbi:MAG: diaminopimelate epimerase [Rhodobacteraceae bacterium]|nr:diaminopimelate epimerase [Paracoccaceae bacterium]